MARRYNFERFGFKIMIALLRLRTDPSVLGSGELSQTIIHSFSRLW
jgi:hypothetical protein